MVFDKRINSKTAKYLVPTQVNTCNILIKYSAATSRTVMVRLQEINTQVGTYI